MERSSSGFLSSSFFLVARDTPPDRLEGRPPFPPLSAIPPHPSDDDRYMRFLYRPVTPLSPSPVKGEESPPCYEAISSSLLRSFYTFSLFWWIAAGLPGVIPALVTGYGTFLPSGSPSAVKHSPFAVRGGKCIRVKLALPVSTMNFFFHHWRRTFLHPGGRSAAPVSLERWPPLLFLM